MSIFLGGGFLLLTGACAATDGTPGMIGYGLAKAAVHQLIKSLSMKGSGMPENSRVLGILPITLDTPANRNSMPNADFSTWTPLDNLSKEVFSWSTNSSAFPNGALVKVTTTGGKTEYSQ
ncbi:hypothetical protein BB560_001205 [Smittium megazygosporum]|uniref:Dihydropteridine reductase n=1 Tax=Smittium megazygosporum TaxID=133381 RepID=A0A2T9ZIA9_9FUNG|nr:hypothetical protein BB560_001205 [Smittium megazygosporum]